MEGVSREGVVSTHRTLASRAIEHGVCPVFGMNSIFFANVPDLRAFQLADAIVISDFAYVSFDFQ